MWVREVICVDYFYTVSDSGRSTASSLGNSVAAHSIPLISFERFTSPGRGMVGRRWKKYLTFLLPFCRTRMPLVAEMRTDIKASLAHIDGTPWRLKKKLPPQRLQNSAAAQPMRHRAPWTHPEKDAKGWTVAVPICSNKASMKFPTSLLGFLRGCTVFYGFP